MKFDDAAEREAWERYGKSVSPRDDPQGPLERAFSHGFRAGLEHARGDAERVRAANKTIAKAWSILTGWDAVRLSNNSHADADDPTAALLRAATLTRKRLETAQRVVIAAWEMRLTFPCGREWTVAEVGLDAALLMQDRDSGDALKTRAAAHAGAAEALPDMLAVADALKTTGGSAGTGAGNDPETAPSGSVDLKPAQPPVDSTSARPPTRAELVKLIEEACSIMFDFQVASADAAPGWGAAERAEDWAERAKAATLEADESEPEVESAVEFVAKLSAAAWRNRDGPYARELIEQRDAAVRAARDREWAAAYVAPGGNPALGPKNPGELTGYLEGRDYALGGIEACKAIRKCKKICEGVALAHGDFKERHFANGARECAELIRALIGEDEDA